MPSLPHEPGRVSDRLPVSPGAPAAWSNTYCSNCLRTRRFFDRATHVVCETCQKRLEKALPLRRSAG